LSSRPPRACVIGMRARTPRSVRFPQSLESVSMASGQHRYVFTSESVSEGHPDKVCDFIADSILDACFEQDRRSRVACEVLCKCNQVVLAGEITTSAHINYEQVVRDAIRSVGYVNADEAFNADSVFISNFLTRQSGEISQGVTAETSLAGEQGAGDQGIMFG